MPPRVIRGTRNKLDDDDDYYYYHYYYYHYCYYYYYSRGYALLPPAPKGYEG